MGRHRIGSVSLLAIPLLLLILFLSSTSTTSTTTITTVAAFLHPRSGGSHIVSSLARAARSQVSNTSYLPHGKRFNRGFRITGSSSNSNHNHNDGMKRPLSAATKNDEEEGDSETQPLYLEEGLFAVHKPLGWTSQDVVGKLRFLLESDAKARNAPDRRTKRRRPWMKVGHGGTLDPLATGVLVCGVGSGTKDLQKYLVGSKAYKAEVTLGYQTTTLDADPKGEIVERKPFDHVTSLEEIQNVLQTQFTGNIQQIPPVFSALKRNGKKLYELGREGQTAEDLKIEPREVVIYDLKLDSEGAGGSTSSGSGEPKDAKPQQQEPIEKFCIDVECGGGTYIRSLVRDIGIALGTVATMTKLERTKQGQFLMEHALPYSSSVENDNDIVKRDEETGAIWIEKKEDCNWTVDSINEAIVKCRETVLAFEDDGLKDK